MRRAGLSLVSLDVLSCPRHQGTRDVIMDAKKLVTGCEFGAITRFFLVITAFQIDD